MAWAKAYLHDVKWHLDPSSRVATIDMGQKFGGSVLFGGGEGWVCIQHNMVGAKAYLRAKFHLDPSNRLTTKDQLT